ncbi:MAG: ATP-binding protein [Endomicrobium sp.]|nr:ATP-binding protein [Endomicrobium sp.]
MYYKRHIEKVVERISKRKPVLVITGARQVGKTTMLKNLYDLNYVTMNTPLTRQDARENPSLFFTRNKRPIIADEIQKAPELFEYVKDVVDSEDMLGQFYLTGSQSFKLMKGVADSLAGRAGVVQMLGLSLREIKGVDYHEPFIPTNEHLEKMRAFKKTDFEKLLGIIHMGSFPELYKNESSLKDWKDYYGSYLQTYIEKDVRDLINVQDEAAFIKFIKAAASRTGQQLNYASLSEACGKDEKTTKNWLSVLQTSGLVYLLQPYYNNFNSRLIKSPKLHFLDTGLACYLLQWNTPGQLCEGAMWGSIFESYVVGEIIKSFYNDGTTLLPLYYYRDKEKNEVDIIIEEAGTLYPIEIKTTSDPSPALAAGFNALKNIPEKNIADGVVVCMVKDMIALSKNVVAIPPDMI